MRALLREQYELVFGRPWPVLTAGLLIGALNVFLFAYDRPWTASDGARNWGDWFLVGAGVLDRPDLIPPWLYSGSLLNLGVLLGGLAAALCAGEFAVRVAPVGELLKGGVGGFLMGVGAVLAFGCNIGGFFSATSALSLSGVAMMVGLAAGAYLGVRYILWELERWPGLSQGRTATWGGDRASVQRWAGALLLLALVLVGPWLYARVGYVPQAGFLLFGVAFGVVFQRSRFCLVRAFREPFLTGEADHTRAAALALIVSLIGFTVLKVTDLKDKAEWVHPAFLHGALLGGLVFGLGMTLAGGCGAGSVWRAGEGHVKLWCAVAMFAVGASVTRLVLAETGLLGKLGAAVFLPGLVGWGGALVVLVGVTVAWYLVAAWNEATRRLSLL